MNHEMPRIWETIISKKADQDIELLALTSNTLSSGAKDISSARFKDVVHLCRLLGLDISDIEKDVT